MWWPTGNNIENIPKVGIWFTYRFIYFDVIFNIFKLLYLPLCVVFDSASATSVLDFFDCPLSSGDELVSILSCFTISGFTSSPSSRLDDVRGDAEALLLGVEEAAPSTHKSPGAGRRGEAGGGVWTRVPLPEARFPDMGAEILGLLVLMVERGRFPSSPPSRSLQTKKNWSSKRRHNRKRATYLSVPVKQWPPAKFSLLHDAILCWINLTMSDRANGFWQTPHVRMSWCPSGSAPSASAVTKS